MKSLPACLFLVLLITACGKSDKNKLAEELSPVIAEIQADKIEQAKRDFERYQRNRSDQKIIEEGFTAIGQSHSVATHFYSFTDSFLDQYRYENTFPLEELVHRYTASFDSILLVLPEIERKSFDYTQSQHKEDLILTVIRMNYDMASLETSVMSQLAENYWVTIIRDDFR